MSSSGKSCLFVPEVHLENWNPTEKGKWNFENYWVENLFHSWFVRSKYEIWRCNKPKQIYVKNWIRDRATADQFLRSYDAHLYAT
jgi:hypothetical protein